jgi:hypothetical protein
MSKWLELLKAKYHPDTYQTPTYRIDPADWEYASESEDTLRYGYARESAWGLMQQPEGVTIPAPVTMNLVEDSLRDSGQVYDRTCLDCLKPLRTHEPIRPVLCVFCVQERAEPIAYLKEDASEG